MIYSVRAVSGGQHTKLDKSVPGEWIKTVDVLYLILVMVGKGHITFYHDAV